MRKKVERETVSDQKGWEGSLVRRRNKNRPPIFSNFWKILGQRICGLYFRDTIGCRVFISQKLKKNRSHDNIMTFNSEIIIYVITYLIMNNNLKIIPN